MLTFRLDVFGYRYLRTNFIGIQIKTKIKIKGIIKTGKGRFCGLVENNNTQPVIKRPSVNNI